MSAQISEFRVYFECLEQAEHFGVEVVKSAFGDRIPVRLVRLPGRTTPNLARSLARSFSMKNPDLVITGVVAKREIPLLWIEISTSVRTEDHALQRFDSMVAASSHSVIYVKVQADRVSGGSHGGRLDFDDTLLFKVAHNELGLSGVQLEWPTTPDRRRAVRSSERPSCPPTDLGLSHLLKVTVESVDADSQVDIATVLGHRKLPRALRDQIMSHRVEIDPYEEGRSSRLFRDGRRWRLKFNRWGHAMDPERGMAWFYRHRLGQRLSGLLHDKDATTRAQAIRNFAKATGVDIPRGSSMSSASIDLSSALRSSAINRAGLAIFENCSDFTVCDIDGKPLVTFQWTSATGNILSKQPLVSRICLTSSINEDEVTYAVSKFFLPKLGLKTHSVSFPGAQGDFALLDGSGRTTKRTYVDVIGVDQLRSASKVLLIESKGKRLKADILKDSAKAVAWRDNARKRAILLGALGTTGAAVLTACAYPGDDFLNPSGTPPAGVDYEICVGRASLRFRSRHSPRKIEHVNIQIPTQYEIEI